MCSNDLTSEQCNAIAESLGRHGRYLSRLVERMNKLGWPQDDLLYARTVLARDAVMSLLVTVHEVKTDNAKPRWMRASGS